MARRSTCIQALEHHARRIGGTPALVQGNRYLTYRDLDRRANQVAHALLEHGLRRAERVAIALPNGFEFMEVACGVWKCAAVAMPFAEQLSDEALVRMLEDSGSVGVVVDEAHAEAVERSMVQLPKLRFMLVVGETRHEDPARGIFDYHGEVERMPVSKPKLPWRAQGDTDIICQLLDDRSSSPCGLALSEKAFIHAAEMSLRDAIEAIQAHLMHIPDALRKTLPAHRLSDWRTAGRLRSAWLGWPRGAGAPLTSIRYNPAVAAGDLRALFASPLTDGWTWRIAITLLRVGGTCFLASQTPPDPQEMLDILASARIRVLVTRDEADLRALLEALDRVPERPRHLDDLAIIAVGGGRISAALKKALLERNLTQTVLIEQESPQDAWMVHTSANAHCQEPAAR